MIKTYIFYEKYAILQSILLMNEVQSLAKMKFAKTWAELSCYLCTDFMLSNFLEYNKMSYKMALLSNLLYTFRSSFKFLF